MDYCQEPKMLKLVPRSHLAQSFVSTFLGPKSACQEVQKLHKVFTPHASTSNWSVWTNNTPITSCGICLLAHTYKKFWAGAVRKLPKGGFLWPGKTGWMDPPEGAYYFLEIHKVCPEKWSDRMLLPNRLTAFRILFRWVTQREAEGPAKGSK